MYAYLFFLETSTFNNKFITLDTLISCSLWRNIRRIPIPIHITLCITIEVLTVTTYFVFVTYALCKKMFDFPFLIPRYND